MNKIIYIVLIIIIGIISFKYYKLDKELDVTYTTLYESNGMVKLKESSLKHIKKENDSLYNFIKTFKPDVIIETVIQYKDTIDNKITNDIDSTYNFKGTKNNFNYNLTINANKLNSYNLEYNLIDSIYVLEKNGDTYIKNKYGNVISSTVHKNKTYNSKFSHGIGIGLGYGFINKKPDVFIGYSLVYNF